MTIDLASLQSRDGARRVFAGPGGGDVRKHGKSVFGGETGVKHVVRAVFCDRMPLSLLRAPSIDKHSIYGAI